MHIVVSMPKSIPGAKQYSLLLLRLIIGGIFFWFGLLAVKDPLAQQGWMAPWILNLPLIGSPTFVLLFGVFELLIAAMLVLGISLRISGLMAAGALASIIVNLGFSEVAMRDAGLLAACLVLATEKDHLFTLIK